MSNWWLSLKNIKVLFQLSKTKNLINSKIIITDYTLYNYTSLRKNVNIYYTV